MIHSTPKMCTHQATNYFGLPDPNVAKMRLRGDGARYSKAEPRVVVYDSTGKHG